MPYLKTVLNKIEKLHGVIFEIPDFAEFGTAFGAVKATRYYKDTNERMIL